MTKLLSVALVTLAGAVLGLGANPTAASSAHKTSSAQPLTTATLVSNAARPLELTVGQIELVTDKYLFDASLATFQIVKRRHKYAGQLDWGTDGCSSVPDQPFGYQFKFACERHDFGYRNYKTQGRFTEAARNLIDAQFLFDLHTICAATSPKSTFCSPLASAYYLGVRAFGQYA